MNRPMGSKWIFKDIIAWKITFTGAICIYSKSKERWRVGDRLDYNPKDSLFNADDVSWKPYKCFNDYIKLVYEDLQSKKR